MKKPFFLRSRQVIVMVGVCVCLMTIAGAVYASNIPTSDLPTSNLTALTEKAILEKEDIIQAYVTYLAEARNPVKEKGSNTLIIEQFGMGTESSVLPSMSLAEAEAAGYLSPERGKVNNTTARSELIASVAVQQHKLVSEQFGPDAWENVTYTLEEIDPIDGELGYRDVNTGELISETEYNRLLRQYWEDIAKKEGVNFYDIFLADDESAEMMKSKRVDIIAKYAEDIPVKLITISDAETYRVNLFFNGKRVSGQKYEDFHFIIDNRKGYWTVFQGLTWAEPVPEYPEGD